MKTCLGCKHHEVIDDRDPDDWFCDDDQAVICKLSPTKPEPNSRFLSQRSAFRRVASACRPYNLRKEATIPTWCPLIEKEKK
jgi:hypothetical protein